MSPLRVPRTLAYGITAIVALSFLVLLAGFALGPALS